MFRNRALFMKAAEEQRAVLTSKTTGESYKSSKAWRITRKLSQQQPTRDAGESSAVQDAHHLKEKTEKWTKRGSLEITQESFKTEECESSLKTLLKAPCFPSSLESAWPSFCQMFFLSPLCPLLLELWLNLCWWMWSSRTLWNCFSSFYFFVLQTK